MFKLINNCESYSDLPVRKICYTSSRKISISYGIIMFDRNRELWLAVKKGLSYGFITLLKAQYRRGDIPTHIADCTKNEIMMISEVLNGSVQFSELYRCYYKFNPASDKEALMIDHKDMFDLSIKSLKGNYKKYTQWEWPKGHKEKGESRFQTALREFREETKFSSHFIVFKDKKITEEYCGSNGCIYKTVYWVASTNNRDIDSKPAKSFKDSSICTKEIDEIGWFKDEDIHKMLRKEKIESMIKAREILDKIS